jgi:hypothetical protein
VVFEKDRVLRARFKDHSDIKVIPARHFQTPMFTHSMQILFDTVIAYSKDKLQKPISQKISNDKSKWTFAELFNPPTDKRLQLPDDPPADPYYPFRKPKSHVLKSQIIKPIAVVLLAWKIIDRMVHDHEDLRDHFPLSVQPRDRVDTWPFDPEVCPCTSPPLNACT